MTPTGALRDRRVPWILAALHVGLGLHALAGDRFLHDEGLLTELFASLVGRDPWPAVFLQKVRPPISILYAPAAAWGQQAFFVLHVVVAALGVPLVAAAARRLGHQAPNVPAAVVALSPMLLAAGAAGVSNADAATGLCLVLWAAAAGRDGLAGVVMGALVWVRSEVAVVALALFGFAVVARRPRALVGLCAWPVLYGLAGAVHHGDLLWMLHFPPALSEPMPGNPFWADHHKAAPLHDLVASLLAISPLLPAVALVRVGSLSRLERWLGAAAVVLVLLLVVMPRWQIFNFDQSPRYLLPVLPMAALAIGRVTEAGWEGGRVTTAWLLGLAAVVLVARHGGAPASTPWAVVVVALVVAASRRGWPRASRLLAGGLLAAGPAAFVAGARLDRGSQLAHLDETVARLREHRGELQTRPIYTNEPALAAFLRRSGGLPEARVFFLVQADQDHELHELTNPNNGQREAIRAALEQGMYGTPVFPDALEPEAIAEGALFVLTRDPRLAQVMPEAVWADRLHVLHPGRGAFVAELRPPPPGRRR